MALGWKLLGSNMDALQVAASQDANTGISAAGTVQADATELKNGVNFVSTVAAGAGVILSSQLAAGDEQLVFNGGLNAVKVYPPVGMKINSLPTNTAATLAINTACNFYCGSTTQIAAVLSA